MGVKDEFRQACEIDLKGSYDEKSGTCTFVEDGKKYQLTLSAGRP